MTTDNNLNGRVHAYVGNGKGKTTAACGLMMRTAGYGKLAVMVQFLKKRQTGESMFAGWTNNIVIRQFGTEDFYRPGKSDILLYRRLCRQGLDFAIEKAVDASLIVLDEVLDAVDYGLIVIDDLFYLLHDCTLNGTEIILTGRKVDDTLANHCDLITEMTSVRHYYDKGISAREGVEF
ncbi:MAG TPA: cob(I)yrinic acid a,c-diamide adenosyltransferase [Spirochaetota bacterium]|nr:cob(I)yrinic acid a,c-diamide adenosyltransferase [Spirochaetota bacterium]